MEINEAFKFCPRCGAKFAKKTSHYLKCEACGLSFYTNPKPAMSVILKNDDDEYLFVVRAYEPRKGYLDFLGGFVDDNEDFEEAARREVKEEAGISVGPLNILSTHKDVYLYDDINYKVAGLTFTADLPKNSKLVPADDVAGFEYYKLDKVPVERLAWESMHEMIEQLKAKLE